MSDESGGGRAGSAGGRQTPTGTKKLATLFQRSASSFSIWYDLLAESARARHTSGAVRPLMGMRRLPACRMFHVSPPLGVPYNS